MLKTETKNGLAVASVQGDLTLQDVSQIEELGVARLVMMTPYWSGVGLGHLVECTAISELAVYCYEPGIDISTLSELCRLKQLFVLGLPAGVIRFDGHSDLEALAITLNTGAKLKLSTDTSRLSSLRILEGNFRSDFLGGICELASLQYLTLKGVREKSLGFLRGANCVKSLTLSYCSALADIVDVAGLHAIEFLKILSSRHIKNYSAMAELKRANIIALDECGPVQSLEEVGNVSLQGISFAGSTRIMDGRISVLDGFSALKYVNFMDRKQYDRARCDFPMDVGWMSAACREFQPVVAH